MQTKTATTQVANTFEGILVERRVSRRSLLRGAGKLMAAAVTATVALPSVSALVGVETGAAREMSGVDLMRAWASSQLPLQWFPGLDWRAFTTSGGTLGFYYPSDWTAEELSEPTPADYSDGTLIAAQATAPDGSATLALGQFLTYDPIDARDAAYGQLAHMVGEGEATLLYEDFAEAGNMAGSFLAADVGGALITIHYIAIQGQLGNTLAFAVASGSTETFDWAVEAAFLPILGQFVTKGGGGGGGGGAGGDGYTTDTDGDGDLDWGSGEPGDVINPDWERESSGNDPGDVINPDSDYDSTWDDEE